MTPRVARCPTPGCNKINFVTSRRFRNKYENTERLAGLVMTVLTVGLVSCAGKSLPRFWPGDFFPVFYACHLAVLGVLAL
ncbi:TPA: hypothetical protein JTK73_004651 [Escherichia coli]|nr:hypothetical protein [Escherichia coli]HAX8425684.1 hypothetical protein [Escherichia coli]